MGRVVCIKLPTKTKSGSPFEKLLKIGEIYTVLRIKNDDWQPLGKSYYILEEPTMYYGAHLFRPIDDTYGPAICEMIEQKIALEEVNV
jgi:hypothetical protein